MDTVRDLVLGREGTGGITDVLNDCLREADSAALYAQIGYWPIWDEVRHKVRDVMLRDMWLVRFRVTRPEGGMQWPQ